MAAGVAALGVVFGDIGTSPLYTLKTVLNLTGSHPDPAAILGALSLLIWTLIVVASVKYVTLAMSIDNEGEGGILALMSLLGLKRHRRPAIVALGLFGAALIYGDGAITPSISVLSALEGLDIAVPALKDYVLPAAVAVLVVLFAIQPLGTARIGRAFGPVMALWFVVLAALGIWGVSRHPTVLAAFNPWLGIDYLLHHGYTSFLVVGGVFLCVTGAEALYADMGHFGARPIRSAWFVLVFPSLLLNYLGQAAIVIEGAPTEDNIFFRLCPQALLLPLILLATVATIIASQSIITGAYSMTRQAIQLGWLPRMRIKQTSQEGYGQIYVGVINWLLAAATIGLTLLFKKSDNLASAYGIAVSATMLMTSALLLIALRECLGWSALLASVVAGALLCVDLGFFSANLVKLLEGGYVPLLLASLVYGVMLIWHRGVQAVAAKVNEALTPVPTFLAQIKEKHVPRVPGTAVFVTRTSHDTPPVMLWHVKKNRALHCKLFVLTVVIESVAWIREGERLTITRVAPDFWRAVARYGFMQPPDIPALLQRSPAYGCDLDLNDLTYYVGRETIVPVENGKGRLSRWEVWMYAAMVRNAVHPSDFFKLPTDAVVEIGRQIAI
jgi:KUP system potassium uptake protein